MRREGKKLGLRSNRSLKKSPLELKLSETITKASLPSATVNTEKTHQIDELQNNIPYSINKKKRWQLADQIKQFNEELSDSEEESHKASSSEETTSKPKTRKERREMEKKAHEAKLQNSRPKNKSTFHKVTQYKSGHVVVENTLHWKVSKRIHLREEIDDGQDIYEIEKIPRVSYPLYSGIGKNQHEDFDMIGYGRTPEKSKWKGKGIRTSRVKVMCSTIVCQECSNK